MPAMLYLGEFGDKVADAFGVFCPYLVGSALREMMADDAAEKRELNDVDVRVILEDAEYERQGFGNPDRQHDNAKWVAMTQAFSALGRQMTGLPIDFQIQQQTHANKSEDHARSALFSHHRRFAPDTADATPNVVGEASLGALGDATQPTDVANTHPQGG